MAYNYIVGETVKIVNNTSNHPFEIGTEVEIERISDIKKGTYLVKSCCQTWVINLKDMKNIITILMLFIGMSVSAQKYVSVSSGVSDKVAFVSGEIGVYSEKTWLSIGYTYVPEFKQSLVGVNTYYNLLSDNRFTTYLYNGVKIDINTYDLVLEPGFAFVYDLGAIAPQAMVTYGIPQDGKAALSASVGINVWIKTKNKN